MKSKECADNKLAKKIRKILLLNTDNEMKRRKKNNHFILINSMNPIQLENKFLQIKEEPTYTPTTDFTYICENHLVERVVDTKKKINYYYSDNLGLKQGMLKLRKKPKNFFTRFSSQTLKMDIIMLLDDEEQNAQLRSASTAESYSDYVPLYSFRLIKKNIFEMKKRNEASTTNLNNKNFCSNKDIHKNNQINNKNHKNSHNKEKNKKIKANNYLRNFCYTKLKKNLNRSFLNKNRNTCTNIKFVERIGKLKNKKEILNNKIEMKKRKKSSSKIKTKKIIKESMESKEDETKNFFIYKSAKNNVFSFLKKLKNNNDINKIKQFPKEDLNAKKNNRRFLKLDTEANIGKKNEDINIIGNKKKKSKIKAIRKTNTRKSTTKPKSNNLFSSPEKFKFRNNNKNKRTHKITLDKWN